MGHFNSKPASDFEFQEILYEKADWVATITINRPFNYNAYSTTPRKKTCSSVSLRERG